MCLLWKCLVLLLPLAGALDLPEHYHQEADGGGMYPEVGVPASDRLEVVSSYLRVTPKQKKRQRRSPGWRKPRDYEFVTRDNGGGGSGGGRSPRRLSLSDSEYDYQKQDYTERRRDPPNKRIIYYASLPDVVRRPGEWTPPRPIGSYYPSASQNEIVTRVHSGLIDVTNGGKYPTTSSQQPVDRFSEDLPPRFTIIDAEPPYNRPPSYPSSYPDYRRYDRYNNRNQVDPYRNYVDPYRNQIDPYRNHIDPYRNQIDPYRNQIDPYRNQIEPYRNPIDPYKGQVDPYRGYYDPLPPYHHQQLPAQAVTVVKRPLEDDERRRPLDVRPLEELVPIHPLSTQAPPALSSSTTTTTESSSSANGVSKFERNFKT